MKLIQNLFKTNDDYGALVLRVMLAIVMFPHGAQKVLGGFGGYGFDGTMKFFTETMHIPAPLALLAITAEFFGPMLLVAGLLSRVAAFGIGVTISVAALTVALPNGFFMNWFGNQKGEGFEYHLLMAGMAAAVVIQGGGKWALDAVIQRRLSGAATTQPAPAYATATH
ncbi:MAG: DoxX family protein [Verrucomicrobiota bacterium]